MAKSKTTNTEANLGFEAKLWPAADALRNNMDAAEYKHVVLGLIFLKYISDAFAAKHAELESQRKQGADPEDPDEYRAAGIFWVPPGARWARLKSSAPQPTIGQVVDDAMTAIERDNPSLKGVLPKDYARPGLDKQRLGQIINLVSDIALGSAADCAKDTLGLQALTAGLVEAAEPLAAGLATDAVSRAQFRHGVLLQPVIANEPFSLLHGCGLQPRHWPTTLLVSPMFPV